MTEQQRPETAAPMMPPAAVTLKAAASVSRTKLAFLGLLLGGGLLAVIAACVALVCVLSAFASARVAGEKDAVEAVIDAAMSAMADRDVDRAYAQFADTVYSAELKSNLESSLDSADFALYADYASLEVSGITIGVQSDTDPEAPHGIVAQVSGETHYADGFVGTFDAVLVKEQDAWKLWGININISPDKLEKYLESQR